MDKKKKSYTKDDIEEFYKDAAKTPEYFYKYRYKTHGILVNYTSKIQETETPCTDYIAEELCKSDLLNKIEKISNPIILENGETYLVQSHDGYPTTQNEESDRVEDRFALALYRHYNCSDDTTNSFKNSVTDKIINYQLPLSRESSREGTADLAAISFKNKKIQLLELKEPKTTETLLRCVCEVYTYYRKLNKKRFTEEIKALLKNDEIENFNIIPCVCVFKDSLPHKQFKDRQHYPNVLKLMKKLGVKMYIISSPNEFDKNNLDQYAEKCIIMEEEICE